MSLEMALPAANLLAVVLWSEEIVRQMCKHATGVATKSTDNPLCQDPLLQKHSPL